MSAPVTVRRRVAAEQFVSPGTVTVDGTAEPASDIPAVPGFVESVFSPLMKDTIDRLLAQLGGEGPLGESAGIVLVTSFGDATTADLASELLSAGQVANPLLFYQAVPTTMLGVVARDHGITGPTSCISVEGDMLAEGLDLADAMLADEGIDQVVLVAVELATADRPAAAAVERPGVSSSHRDAAVAFVLRADESTGGAPAGTDPVPLPEPPAELGEIGGLVSLYAAVRTARTRGGVVGLDVPAALGARAWEVVP